jgi:hypothetical protein
MLARSIAKSLTLAFAFAVVFVFAFASAFVVRTMSRN